MGHEIEEAAVRRGHLIRLVIDIDNKTDLTAGNLAGIDVAIEFTTPGTALENITTCLEAGVPVVSGTTGWLDDFEKASVICKKKNVAFIHSSNFSIGVNILFRLNAELAARMNMYSDYSASIDEIHHVKKLDAPSGTAISLAEGIINHHQGYNGWCNNNDKSPGRVPIQSLREGTVPGTHIVTWDSPIDSLTLRHEAKNRKGLALGAVVAAEFIRGKKGIFTMTDVLGL